MKRWFVLAGLILASIAIGAWKAEPVMLSWLAGKIEKTSLQDRIALIEPSVQIRMPENADGPVPVVLLFHGCAGKRQTFQDMWAKTANEAGYAAIIIDSMTPRGYSRQDALDIVCAGKALIGQERAGDVLAAIEIAKADNRLDTDHMVLTGWSHGAWAVMDYLTMDMGKRRPAGLDGDLGTPQPLDGVILFYPYCGRGALSRFRPWAEEPPVLALIAGADTIVNAQECIRYFEKKEHALGTVDMTVYPGAEHAFDDPFLEEEWIRWHNPDFLEDARARFKAFLRARAAPSS